MRITRNFLFVLSILFLSSCGSKYSASYHMNSPLWNVEDYDEALYEMNRSKMSDEPFPCLSNPELSPVFLQLVNKQNVIAILTDDELGLNHRAEVGNEYFRIGQEIERFYTDQDIQDKYVYPKEFVMALDFFLTTQVLYFEIGNQNAEKNAINSLSTIESNKHTVINNFVISLQLIMTEDAFDKESIPELAMVLDKQFDSLVEAFPNSPTYSNLKSKAENLSIKAKSPSLKTLLAKVISVSSKQIPHTANL